MQVLVTRPRPEAERTAETLRRLGHTTLIAPLSRIDGIERPLPPGPFEAIVLSSQNAVRHGVARLSGDVLGLPVFAVGARTAEAARAAGCAQVQIGPGDAAGLAKMLVGQLKDGARLLYLAGVPRKPELEARLGEAGFRLAVAVVYRACTVETLPEPAREALLAGRLDAVLHYSHEAAARFMALAAAAGLTQQARGLRHLCLSGDVARPLAGVATILLAKEPNEGALLRLLDDCRSAN